MRLAHWTAPDEGMPRAWDRESDRMSVDLSFRKLAHQVRMMGWMVMM